jgi:hypothetical protein
MRGDEGGLRPEGPTQADGHTEMKVGNIIVYSQKLLAPRQSAAPIKLNQLPDTSAICDTRPWGQILTINEFLISPPRRPLEFLSIYRVVRILGVHV